MTLQHDILKGLVLQYQQTRNPVVFEKILKRVDGLIIDVINTFKKRTSYLEGIELEELYQIGIIGLYDATITSPANEKAEKFPQRIAAYIKSNIRRTFEYRDKEKAWLVVDKNLGEDGCEFETHAEFLDLLNAISYMYIKGQLSIEEIKLLRDRFFKQQSLNVLGKNCKISHEWVRQKIIVIIDKIREYFSDGNN